MSSINGNIKMMVENILMFYEEFSSENKNHEPLSNYYSYLNRKKNGISKVKSGYKLVRDGKTYFFKKFTNDKIEKTDVDAIRNKSLDIHTYLELVLGIVGSHQLTDAKFVLGKSMYDFRFLVDYYKDGKRYIIDVFYDIIMEKDSYYDLMQIEEINVLDSVQVFNMYRVCMEMNGKIPLMYFILFYDEMMPYFNKLMGIKTEGYNKYGINVKNEWMYEQYCDDIFDHPSKRIPTPEFDDINFLTLNPEKFTSYKDEDDYYEYNNYLLRLISDYFDEGELKSELLSKDRFGTCHLNSTVLFLCLHDTYCKEKNSKVNLKLVSGKCFYNKKSFTYHTWVEFERDNKTFCFDFTQNLIMKKSDYYKYASVEVLSELESEEAFELFDLVKENDINMSSRIINILGNELLTDLRKLKKVMN